MAGAKGHVECVVHRRILAAPRFGFCYQCMQGYKQARCAEPQLEMLGEDHKCRGAITRSGA